MLPLKTIKKLFLKSYNRFFHFNYNKNYQKVIFEKKCRFDNFFVLKNKTIKRLCFTKYYVFVCYLKKIIKKLFLEVCKCLYLQGFMTDYQKVIFRG